MDEPEISAVDKIADGLGALIFWIQRVTVHVAAIEAITRERLNVSDAEWSAALQKAHAASPLPSPQIDGLAAVIDFLERTTGPL